MRYRNQKIILLTTIGFLVSFSLASAKNFTIYNAANINQPYFSVDGTSGNVGIGLTNPTTPLQMLNSKWISAQNAAGTGVVNMFRVNANDQIEVGAPLNIGSFEFSPDSGLVTFVDMPVSSAPAAGTLEGYALKMDGDNMMTVYSEANGLGGIQNKRIGIGLANPAVALDVSGAFRNSLATTHSLLDAAGNVVVMADNTGTLYSTPLTTFTSANSLWGGTKNGNIWNGDAGVGNVGVGMTNPTQKLQIDTGVSTFNQGIPATSGSIQKGILRLTPGAGTFGESLDFGMNVGPTYAWIQATNKDGLNTNYNLSLNPNGGNVGIGTAGPLSKLDIVGVSQIAQDRSSHFQLSTGTGVLTNEKLIFGVHDGDYSWIQAVAPNVAYRNLVLNASGGNVGIGTTAPQGKLSIAGDNVNKAILRLQSTQGVGTGWGLGEYQNAIEFFQLDEGNPDGDGKVATRIQQSTYDTYGNTRFDIFTNIANGDSMPTTPSFSIKESNVGIGITNPGAALDISGSLRNSLATTHSLLGNAGNTVVMADNTGTLYNTPLSTFTSANNLWGGTKNGNIWNGDAGVGNVGIGTTNPQNKLDIQGAQGGFMVAATNLDPASGYSLVSLQNSDKLLQGWNYGAGTGEIDLISNRGGGNTGGFRFYDYTNAGTMNALVTMMGNGNVGIGTTAPGAKLHVYSGASGQATPNNDAKMVIESGGGNVLNLLSPNANYSAVYFGSPTNASRGGITYTNSTYSGALPADSLSFNTAGNSSSMLINNNGNVGIGTTNPGYSLDVNGATGFNSIQKIGPGSNNPERGAWNPLWSAIASGRAQYTDEEFASGYNSISVYNNNGGDGVQFFWENGDGSQPNSSGKWIRIYNNGNTTSPGFGGFITTIDCSRNKTFVQRFRAKLPVGYVVNIAENSQGTNNTSYWLTSQAGTGKWEEYIRVSHCGNGGSWGNGGHVYVTGGSSSVFTWYLASANVYEADGLPGIFSGNVGVGIANPGAKLDVSGSLRNSLATTHSLLGNAGNTVVMADNTGTLYNTPLSTFASTNSLWGGIKNGNIWNGDAGVGNVGIGTTNPAEKLEVSTGVRFSGGYISIIPPAGTAAVDGGGGDLRLFGYGNIIFRNGAASTESMRILNNGNVGIGTTNPLSKLSFGNQYPDYRNRLALYEDGGGYFRGIGMIHPDSSYGVGIWAKGGATLPTDSNADFVVRDGGNVGVGTTNPGAKLHVEGSSNSELNLGRFFNTSTGASSAASIFIGQGTAYGKALSIYHDYTNQVASLVIYGDAIGSGINQKAGGNVGIGTTNPGRKLVVAGPDDGNGQLRLMGTLDTVRWWDIGRESAVNGRFKINEYNNGVENERFTILMGGNVGIGLTNPGTKLDISGSLRNSLATTHSLLGGAGNVVIMADNTGTLYATSSVAITGGYLPLTGGALTGTLNMGGQDILNINKLQVNTIDPLYNIKGINYSTFASSIAGGVKEEYIGRADIKVKSSVAGEREYVIDFDNIEKGSDLWVWRQTVDFSDKNVEILITPYGGFAQVYSSIENNKIIFKADRPVSVHYRLSGRRIDWQNWPTKAKDQTEKAGFVIE